MVRIFKLTAAQATLGGALLALIGGVAGAYIAGRSSEIVASTSGLSAVDVEKIRVEGDQRLEESKQSAAASLAQKDFETKLIFEAIKAPSRKDAIRNLRFFVSAGFLADAQGKISALRDDELPSLSAPSHASLSKAIESTGVISYIKNSGAIVDCTATAVSPRQAITKFECAGDPTTYNGNMTMFIGGNLYQVRPVMSDNKRLVTLLQLTAGLFSNYI